MKYPKEPFNAIQKPHEFEQLLLLFMHYAPRRIMEIGVGHGGGVWAWAFNSKPGVHITAISLFAGILEIRDAMQEWAATTGTTIAAFNGNTHDPAIAEKARALGPYDWIHIDAGHAYDDVKADYEMYRPMLAKNGIIVFHDIGVKATTPEEMAYCGVRALWDELTPHHATTQIIDAPNDPLRYFGIGVLFT